MKIKGIEDLLHNFYLHPRFGIIKIRNLSKLIGLTSSSKTFRFSFVILLLSYQFFLHLELRKMQQLSSALMLFPPLAFFLSLCRQHFEETTTFIHVPGISLVISFTKFFYSLHSRRKCTFRNPKRPDRNLLFFYTVAYFPFIKPIFETLQFW